MALYALSRFFDLHLFMAPHALEVIGAQNTRHGRSLFIPLSGVAVCALRRFIRCGAVMMASLTDGILLIVEMTGEPVVFHAPHERIDDLPVREFDRLVFFGKSLDRNCLGNVAL